MAERDDFDKIVQGLEFDLSFPAEPADPIPDEPAEPVPDVDDGIAAEEPFYRKVTSAPLMPRRRGPILAWCGLLGAPLALVLATVAGEILPRPILAGAVLTFVAAAIYLISQLPEHGPSRRDWPDDGAVL